MTIADALDRLAADVNRVLHPPVDYGAGLAQATEDTQGNRKPYSIFTYDYTQTNASGYIKPQIRGDWLAVARSSVGAPPCFLNSANDIDDAPLVLAPGRVINQPFQTIRIFVGSAATADAPSQGLTNNPRLILVYGVGPCPFTSDTSLTGSDSPTSAPFPNSAGVALLWQSSILVPPGSIINVSGNFAKTLTVASLSNLGCLLLIGSGQNYASPDCNTVFPASTVGGVSSCIAKFSNVRISKGTTSVAFLCHEMATTAGGGTIAPLISNPVALVG